MVIIWHDCFVGTRVGKDQTNRVLRIVSMAPQRQGVWRAMCCLPATSCTYHSLFLLGTWSALSYTRSREVVKTAIVAMRW